MPEEERDMPKEEIQKKSILQNPEYLTPSKAGKISRGNWDFLQNYLFKNRPPESLAMETGKLVHDIFYSLIRLEGSSDNLKPIPEKWKTKKECGMSIEEQKKLWHKEQEKNFYIPYPQKLQQAIDHMKIFIKLNPIVRDLCTDKLFATESVLEDKQKKIAGILDMLSTQRVFDVKTTSKEFKERDNASEFIKWNEESFAVQQIVYEHLLDSFKIHKPEKFLFCVIQLSWPYKVMLIELHEGFVDLTRKIFWAKDGIYERWKTVQESLEENFKKEREMAKAGEAMTFEHKVDAWRKLAQLGFVKNFSQIFRATPSNYYMSELRKKMQSMERKFEHNEYKEFN